MMTRTLDAVSLSPLPEAGTSFAAAGAFTLSASLYGRGPDYPPRFVPATHPLRKKGPPHGPTVGGAHGGGQKRLTLLDLLPRFLAFNWLSGCTAPWPPLAARYHRRPVNDQTATLQETIGDVVARCRFNCPGLRRHNAAARNPPGSLRRPRASVAPGARARARTGGGTSPPLAVWPNGPPARAGTTAHVGTRLNRSLAPTPIGSIAVGTTHAPACTITPLMRHAMPPPGAHVSHVPRVRPGSILAGVD